MRGEHLVAAVLRRLLPQQPLIDALKARYIRHRCCCVRAHGMHACAFTHATGVVICSRRRILYSAENMYYTLMNNAGPSKNN
jgi:hypothetical protein